jgi:phosphatidylinositol alpha-mannosyltransferase
LGRLVERKGCMQLLKALDLLNQKHRLGNVRVLICGKGELREELEKYAHDKKLGGVVHFVGFVTEQEKANYLATAQIAVFPSMGGESFGIVLVEAMAAGSEVVLGGNNPGYRSVLGERPKQLVKATNTKLFAASLQYYMSSTKPRETAYKWQQEAVKQYDVAVVGKNIIDIYKASVAKRSI